MTHGIFVYYRAAPELNLTLCTNFDLEKGTRIEFQIDFQLFAPQISNKVKEPKQNWFQIADQFEVSIYHGAFSTTFSGVAVVFEPLGLRPVYQK